MWLIDVETRKLVFFASCEEISKRDWPWKYDATGRKLGYAILSHTWEGEEVTYQEFRDGTAKEKKGYDKIMKTCDQAQKDELPYAWVDTCCINKESSAEVSEAINSMWKYYQEAEVCYAFLSDVVSEGIVLTDGMLISNFGGTHAVNERAQELWNDQVIKSRWFTRGWTLQELIASMDLILFNSAWDVLGKKSDLPICLSELTGIDAEVLNDPDEYSMSYYTIAKKMSWAAGRRTSYVEDRAYSLLGLFDINMPLLYGEGKKAFTRLQKEIIKSSTDTSFLAFQRDKDSGRTIGTIFADSPDQFANYRNVVPWEGRLESMEFRLTNQGLEFKKLYTIEGVDAVLGLLNCRFEHDFSGPLALKLRPHHKHRNEWDARPVPGWTQNSTRDSTREFAVEPCQNLTRLGIPPDSTHVDERVSIVLNIESREIYEGPAVISESWPISQSDAYAPMEQAIWVRGDERSNVKINIVDAVPEGAWRFETGVMLLKYGLSRGLMHTEFREYFAGVTVEITGEVSHLLDIGFGFRDSVDFDRQEFQEVFEFKVADHVDDRGL